MLLYRRFGGWETLAKALRSSKGTLRKVGAGATVSASLAVRVAHLVNVPVSDVLDGRYPPRCPHCGAHMEKNDPGEKNATATV
jgi:hypothetical protein